VETTEQEASVLLKRHLHPEKHQPKFIYRKCKGCKRRFRVNNLAGYFDHLRKCAVYKAKYEDGE